MGTRRNGVVIVNASKKDIKDKKWMVVYSDGNGTYANFYKTFLGMSSRAKWERKVVYRGTIENALDSVILKVHD